MAHGHPRVGEQNLPRARVFARPGDPQTPVMTTFSGPAPVDSWAALRDLVRRHPARLAFAVGFAALLLVWTDAIDQVPFRSTQSLEFYQLGDRLLMLCAAVLAAVPLVALRWTVLAGALALAPMLLVLIGETGVPITMYVAPVLAGGIAWQRSRRAGAALALLGLAVVAPVIAASWRRLEVYDTISVDFGRGQGSDLPIGLGAYAVAAGLLLAVAEAARRSGERAARVRALEARAGEVEQQAAVTEERARLARDLHDVVAHHVSLIAVRAETAPYTTADLGGGGKEVLAEIAADSRRALDELRGVLGVLRRSGADPDLTPLPTAADIPDLVERAVRAGESVTWTDDPSDLAHVPAPIGYAGYRAVQEALTNARRHAAGRPVEVTVRGDGSGLWLRVVTDLASPVGAVDPGRGLSGSRERVEALGGTFLAGPAGDTFVVEADLRG